MNYRFLSLLPVPVVCVLAGVLGYDFNKTAAGGLFALECVATGLVVHGLFFGAADVSRDVMNILTGQAKLLTSLQSDVDRLKADSIEQIEARKEFAKKFIPGDPWNQG